MNKISLIAALALILSGCSQGSAVPETEAAPASFGHGEASCSRFFAAGKPPSYLNPPKGAVRPLCFRSFTVLHSAGSRTALWSAEIVTKASLQLAYQTSRAEQFHPEEALPASERAELADYRGSGFDRGHLVPEGDMPSDAASTEAFSLANMAPQAAGLNRNSWKDLETSVRRQARHGDVYVVTGPLFVAKASGVGKRRAGRVLIPSHFYKAIYSKDFGAAVMVATNDQRPRWSAMTVDQFNTLYQVDPFPGLDLQYRQALGQIASTGPDGAHDAGSKGSAASSAADGPKTRMVRHPVTGQWISEKKFIDQFGRHPRPDEYESEKP